jgi:ferredoxin-NADP reductase
MGAFGTKLLEKLPRVADIVSFRFKRPEAYTFQPGQWFVVTFPSSDPQEPWEHHFSHSDAPSEPWLEFTTRMRGSDFKNALDALPVGSPVQLEGPFGTFVLPPDAERVAFLAGGIGITCVRSILRWLCDTCGTNAVPADPPRTPPQEIVLFFANHSEYLIPFKEELDEIARDLPELRLVHVISQPGGLAGVPGPSGRKGHGRRIARPRRVAVLRQWPTGVRRGDARHAAEVGHRRCAHQDRGVPGVLSGKW